MQQALANDKITLHRIGDYRIGSMVSDISVLEQLVYLLEQPVTGNGRRLGGRCPVALGEIEGVGRVAVKHYRRGGLLGYLIESSYLRWGESRSKLEFDLLARAREIGVRAPEPVAFVSKGSGIYQAWLVTREIEEKNNLADLSLADDGLTLKLMSQLIEQVELLIRNRIFHVDLHPGNVLVDRFDSLYIVDFDKAYHFDGEINVLRDNYLCRWRRAVIKHHLPEALSELMCVGLRRNFEHR